MHNYTEYSVVSNLTGEFISDFENTERKSMYFGPRLYWRTMIMYDQAQLAVPTEIGIKLLQHLKGYCSTNDYTIHFKAQELADIFSCGLKPLRNAINKLRDGNFIHRISNEYYIINPDMFWIKGMSDTAWQRCKDVYESHQPTQTEDL